MPITYPTYDEIIDRIRADLIQFLPTLDPTIAGSFARAFADSLGGRAYDVTLLQKQLEKQMFPQTADGDFLENRWAAYEGLTRNPATPSTGEVNITGSAGPNVPAGTKLSDANGNLYSTQSTIVLVGQSVGASALTRISQTAYFIGATAHNFYNGQEITISGATPAGYNGTFKVSIINDANFSYGPVSASLTTPASGTIVATYDGAMVDVESDGTGQDKNLTGGATLTLVTPIAGVDNSTRVGITPFAGGTDLETDTELRLRVLESRSNPTANFNEAAIIKQAKTVSGVTRVWVKRAVAGGSPPAGDVTTYFVRDNDASIIPDGTEIAAVKSAIEEIAPANTPLSSIIVLAPGGITTNYTFTALSPDTPTMRTAIENNLTAFYEDEVDFEVTITEDKYRNAIIDTVDPETGDALDSFTLSGPSGDVTISTGQIGLLGTIIFP